MTALNGGIPDTVDTVLLRDWLVGCRPPTRVRELMRQAAKLVVNTSQKWYDDVATVMLSSEYMQAMAGDPLAVKVIARSNRSNQQHWAAANISHPGDPVPANLGAETLAIARYLVRHGMDEAAVVETFRLGESVALRSWMQIVFGSTSDPEEMRELFDVSERSIRSFLSAQISEVQRQLRIERDELTRGTHAERRKTVALILDGAPITRQHAEKRFDYNLEQNHTAAVIWGGDESSIELSDLDRAIELLAHAWHGCRPLTVFPSCDTRWVWLHGVDDADLAGVAAAMSRLPGVRIAIGSTAAGIEGFRRSHLDAITTQRVMTRLGPSQRIASFTDVQLLALITADPEQANRFIKYTLGDFESADAELRRTVLTFIHEQCSAARTAARLFTHRNTVDRRLARARELLPQPLEGATVHVALALEALRCRDAGGL